MFAFFDFLSREYTMPLSKDKSHKNMCGGCFSLILIIASAYLAI